MTMVSSSPTAGEYAWLLPPANPFDMSAITTQRRDIIIPSTRRDGMRPHVVTKVSVPHAPSLWADWVATSVPFAVALLLALILLKGRRDRAVPEGAMRRRAKLGGTWSRAATSVARVPAGGWALLSGSMAALLTLTAMLDAVDYSSVIYIMQWLLLPGIVISSLGDSWVENNPMTALKLCSAAFVNFAFWALIVWGAARRIQKKG